MKSDDRGSADRAPTEGPSRDGDGRAAGSLEADERRQDATAVDAETLSVIAHELRNPLNGVLGGVALLRETGLNPGQQRLVELISSSGEAVLGQLSNLVSLGRLGQQEVELLERDFYLYDVLTRACDVFHGQAKDNRTHLSYSVDERAETYLVGDVGRIEQIVLNLVSNAVKVTRDGSVRIEASTRLRTAQEGGGLELELAVVDTGPGIPEEAKARLFEPFYRVPGTPAAGTGIGLAVVQHLVSNLAGHLEITDVEGGGTRFGVALPLGRQESPDRRTAMYGAPPEGLRLFVDMQSHEERGFLTGLVQGWAPDIELLAKAPDPAPAGEQRHALLTDDPTRKAESGLAVLTIVDANDAGVGPGAVAVVRPVTRASLFTSLARALERDSADLSGPTSRDHPRILVVDDARENRILVRDLLQTRGFVVSTAQHVEEALGIYRQAPFDLLLIDLSLGAESGIDLLHAMRDIDARTGRASKPAIAMTAHTEPRQVHRVLAAGFHEHLAKPIGRTALFSALERGLWTKVKVPKPKASNPPLEGKSDHALGRELSMAVLQQDEHGVRRVAATLRQDPKTAAAADELIIALDAGDLGAQRKIVRWLEEGAPEEGRPTPAAPSPAASAIPKMPTPGLIPAPAAKARIAVPSTQTVEDVMKSLRPKFWKQRQLDVDALRSAAEQGEREAVRRIAHSIVGTGTTFGYPEVTALGRRLEQASASAAFDEVRELIEELADNVTRHENAGSSKGPE